MTSSNKTIAAVLAATLIAGAASTASAVDNFTKIPNAGIPGHNQETHEGISRPGCLQLCNERNWCMSADYERAVGKCFLQPVNRHKVPLRTDYPGSPYDHYHNESRLIEHGVLEPAQHAKPNPAPTTSNQGTGQCGQRVTIDGLAAVGLVYDLRKARAERRAKRAWRAYVGGASGSSTIAELFGAKFIDTNHPSYGLGTRYADLDKAKDVVINCDDGTKMKCWVTATPCAW